MLDHSLLLGPEGTIYEKEKGFDDSLRIEINPTKISFIKELKSSEASSIFHVDYEDKPRVLKVVCILTINCISNLSVSDHASFTTTTTLDMPTMESVT